MMPSLVARRVAFRRSDRPGFASRERDDESGLMHFRARSYDPRVGRFVQKDPDVGRRWRHHFVYVRDNPTRFRDPKGLYEVDVHYYMTYYLARKNGFTRDQAEMIAGATQYVDNSGMTQPVRWAPVGNNRRILLTFHFAQEVSYEHRQYGPYVMPIAHYAKVRRNTASANRIFDVALAERSLAKAGIGLHLLQDSYAHEGYDITAFPHAGHGAENVLGITPDNPNRNAESRSKALDMAKRVNTRLGELATRMGVGGTRFSEAEVDRQLKAVFSIEKYRATGPELQPSYQNAGGGGGTVWEEVTVTKEFPTSNEWVRARLWQDFISDGLGEQVQWNPAGWYGGGGRGLLFDAAANELLGGP